MKIATSAAAVLLASTGLAHAGAIESVTLSASADNTLYESPNGSLSNGAGQYLFAGRTAGGETRRGLLQFDIASMVPAGATILEASLTLHVSRAISGELDVSLYRSLAAWGEGTSDASGQEGGGTAATAGDATWLYTFYQDQFWNTPGGDFVAAASATTAVGDVGFYTWNSAGSVADVQAWLDAPELNAGWFVRGNEDGNATAKRFDSRENPTETFRPELTVRYAIPTPGAAGLLGLAGIAATRRRR